MRLMSEIRFPLDHIGSRVANVGASFAFGVAYLLFILMFLVMVADTILAIVRAW